MLSRQRRPQRRSEAQAQLKPGLSLGVRCGSDTVAAGRWPGSKSLGTESGESPAAKRKIWCQVCSAGPGPPPSSTPPLGLQLEGRCRAREELVTELELYLLRPVSCSIIGLG